MTSIALTLQTAYNTRVTPICYDIGSYMDVTDILSEAVEADGSIRSFRVTNRCVGLFVSGESCRQDCTQPAVCCILLLYVN